MGETFEKVEARCSGTEALSQWISSVRAKRMALRARGELRAMVVLGRALRRAEDELLKRQRARASRWARLQPLLAPAPPPATPQPLTCADRTWQDEISRLDDFFEDLDSVLVK